MWRPGFLARQNLLLCPASIPSHQVGQGDGIVLSAKLPRLQLLQERHLDQIEQQAVSELPQPRKSKHRGSDTSGSFDVKTNNNFSATHD